MNMYSCTACISRYSSFQGDGTCVPHPTPSIPAPPRLYGVLYKWDIVLVVDFSASLAYSVTHRK